MAKSFFLMILFSLYLFAKIDVVVSILPQKYFVKKIAGDLVSVEVMVPPGSEPADYEPKPRQLTHLVKSKIYFSVKVPFERNWVKKFKDINKNMMICDTTKGIKKMPMTSAYSFINDNRKRKRVDENSLDPHIWLSPLLVEKMANNIKNCLIKIDPKNKEIYEKNLKNFLKQIKSLHLYGIEKLADLKKREFIVFHPVWGYFAKEFDLKQIPIEIEGKSPKLSTLVKLVKYAKKRGIRVIFVQPEFSKKSAKMIAESIDAKVVTLDPLDEDWQRGIKNAIDAFREALNR